jgi:hypothetical protein
MKESTDELNTLQLEKPEAVSMANDAERGNPGRRTTGELLLPAVVEPLD